MKLRRDKVDVRLRLAGNDKPRSELTPRQLKLLTKELDIKPWLLKERVIVPD